MNILFTCGGTAGHINPAVALARLFQERKSGCNILFVGSDGGMETNLVPKEGFPIETVTVDSFFRSLTPHSIKHNLRAVANLERSRRQAEAILDRFRPDLVVGTGGYASYPVVHAAAKRGIPTAVHESNAVPGLTTKALSKVVDVVMVGFEASRSHYDHPEKVVVTGTPVRGDFFRRTRAEARRELGLTDRRPLVVSVWGSLGAKVMNQYTADLFRLEQAAGAPFRHIHGAGWGYAELSEQLGRLPDGLEVREYIYDMPLVMGAADLVLCRAGASTIAELAAIARPCVLVPSPNVTNDHQTKNAKVLSDAGGAVLLPEAQCSGQVLYDTVTELLAHPERRQEMAAALGKFSGEDTNERIYQTLLGLLR